MQSLSFKQRIYQRYWRWLSQYLNKRQPASDSVRLTQKLIFILPSRYGCWFMLLIALLYLLGTNYQNNLILLVSYLLLSIFLLCIVLCYQNLAGLSLSCKMPTELFSGQPGAVSIQLGNNKNHFMLQLNFLKQDTVFVNQSGDMLALPLYATVRGRYMLPRIKVKSLYPFGLWRSWSYVALAQHYWVYPQPVSIENTLRQQSPSSAGAAEPAEHSIDAYRSGDNVRYLLWKRLARDPFNPVLRREQHHPVAEPDWVEVPKCSGDVLERELSIACRRLLELEQSGRQYGLKLNGRIIAQSQGAQHLQRCLQALALC